MAKSTFTVTKTKYSIGDLVHHKLFDYRGVIVDVDPTFQSTDEWYEIVARSRPPKDEPWYHILVNDTSSSTYVAEQNLEPDPSGKKIKHPMVEEFFTDLRDGRYINDEKMN